MGLNLPSILSMVLAIVTIGLQLWAGRLKKQKTKRQEFVDKFKKQAEYIRKAVADEDTIDVNILLNDLVRDAEMFDKESGIFGQKVRSKKDGSNGGT